MFSEALSNHYHHTRKPSFNVHFANKKNIKTHISYVHKSTNPRKNIIMADEKTIINVDLSMFGQDADAKTAAANKVAKELGISDEALAQVEDFKRALTAHNAWDLPFMGYVNEDGYGYAYVPDAAITMNPYWDAHKEFMNLPYDVQTAFAIRMLFTHRPVDRYGADMFLHYHRGFEVNFVGSGANKY